MIKNQQNTKTGKVTKSEKVKKCQNQKIKNHQNAKNEKVKKCQKTSKK